MSVNMDLGMFSAFNCHHQSRYVRFSSPGESHLLSQMSTPDAKWHSKTAAVVNGYGKRSVDLEPEEQNSALRVGDHSASCFDNKPSE